MCYEGYSGFLCERAYCTPTYCRNNGECRVVSEHRELVCQCPRAFYGDRCQIALFQNNRQEDGGGSGTRGSFTRINML
jgi:hypothetical protein